MVNCPAMETRRLQIISTTLLAFSMSADAFAVALCKGAAMPRPRLMQAMRTGALFGAVEAVTPVIGWSLGTLASSLITEIDHWIAFFLLTVLGMKMIRESRQSAPPRLGEERQKFRALILAALGTSIDAMGVGVSLAFVEANIWAVAAMIGLATFLMATLGIMMGHMIGTRIGKLAEAVGGLVLICIGIKILLEHTGAL